MRLERQFDIPADRHDDVIADDGGEAGEGRGDFVRPWREIEEPVFAGRFCDQGLRGVDTLRVTVTSGSTPPCSSFTVPLIQPLWICAKAGAANASRSASTKPIRFI